MELVISIKEDQEREETSWAEDEKVENQVVECVWELSIYLL